MDYSRFSLIAIHLALCESVLAGGLRLGHVSDSLSSGGGCSLQLPSDFARKTGDFVFVSDFEGHGLINIDGVDVQLTISKSKEGNSKKQEQLGDRSSYVYEAS